MVAPDRVAFSLFGRDIYWYGVLMSAAILIGIWLAMREGKRKKLAEDTIIDMSLVMIPAGLVGARLYYVIFEWASYASDPIRIFYIWEGGLAIYGAIIGGLIGLYVFSRIKKVRFLRLIDCIAPGLVLAQAIGRWGNYFNQEAFGLPINNGALIFFPFAVEIEGFHTFNGVPCSNPYHMATFFYESMWCLIVFLIIWSIRKRFRHDGDAFLTYAMLYGFERMLIEPLRGDSLYLIRPGVLFEGGIRVSQMLAFVVAVSILVFFLLRRSREKKLGVLIWPAPEAVLEPCEAAMDEDCAKKSDTAEDTEQQHSDEDAAASAGTDSPAGTTGEE